MGIKDLDIENKNIISQKCYPTRENLKNMAKTINSVPSDDLRRLLSLISCSGLRCGEALNSFIYKDEGKWMFQAVIEKKKYYTHHTMPDRMFMGDKYLTALLDKDVWKSANLKFIFPDLNVGWMSDYISDDPFTPTWLFEGCEYKKLWAEIKKLPKMEVSYFRGKYMKSVKVTYNPSFHFFRKSFVAQSILTIPDSFRDAFHLAKYMCWDNVNELFSYYKELGLDTTSLDSSKGKFHYKE